MAVRATACVIFEYLSSDCGDATVESAYADLVSELAARKNEEDRRKRLYQIREERRPGDDREERTPGDEDWDMVDYPSPL